MVNNIELIILQLIQMNECVVMTHDYNLMRNYFVGCNHGKEGQDRKFDGTLHNLDK